MARMVGGRLYGGGRGDAGGFLQGEGVISQEAMEALFVSSSSASAGFHGSRSMMCFEDFNAAAAAAAAAATTAACPHPRQFEMEETGEDDLDEFGLHQPEKKRRLTVDQVQFLEKSFEAENKLEPERKMQLARDLCLQPRQVAIWFQNRRARWKTKQIEKEYEALQSSFDALKKDYDDIVKEKEKLEAEVQDLKEKILLKEKAGSSSSTTATNSSLDLPIQTSSCSSQPLPPPPPCKLEDLCSANSADLDCENSHNYVEEVWHSDLSAPEEDEEEKRFESIGYGGFDDATLWFWQYE